MVMLYLMGNGTEGKGSKKYKLSFFSIIICNFEKWVRDNESAGRRKYTVFNKWIYNVSQEI